MRRNKKKTRSQCLRRCYVHKSNPERCAQLGKNVPRDLSLEKKKKLTRNGRAAKRNGRRTRSSRLRSVCGLAWRVRRDASADQDCRPMQSFSAANTERDTHTERERERERERTETRTEWQKRSRGPRCRCSSGRPKGHPTRSDLVMDAAVAPPPEPRAPTNGGPAPPPSPGATGWPCGNVTWR